MKKIIIIIILLILNINTVAAEDNTYQVAVFSNQEYTILYQSSEAEEINQFYEDNINLFDNLIILKNDEVIKMEYGIVSFNINNSCNINVEFLNVNNRTDGYVNGCYGRDAAYIKTNDNLTTIDFIQSGTYGRVDVDEVELFPLENIINISAYEVIDDQLIHEIKGNLEDDKYISMINLGDAPIYLNEGNIYYSFDSHYFYNNIKVMLDDYINLNYDNAINVTNPYYNYYMYLSHRSISNYNIDELNSYFNDYLLVDSNLREFDANFNSSISDIYNQSQYNNKLEAFVQYQYQFGANSLMMLSLSMNETASGRSSLSFRRNNLFGHAAYDSNVEANARRYNSVENSIYSHAKVYISKTYLNTEKFQYHGGFFGNKESGMNVSYASDPYWGEKASSYFYQLDKQMGLKDYNNYCIGISNDFDKVNIYNDINDVIYTTNVNNMSFVLIEEVGQYYRVQYEESFDQENYNYDFESNYAYVLKEDIDIILNKDKLDTTKVYKSVLFDANGGTYNDGNFLVEYKMLVDDIECAITPSKEGYLFSNYDENNIAKYNKIKNISLSEDYQIDYYLNDKINLSNVILTIETANQTILYPVDSTMVDKTYFNELGEQLVTINLQNNLTSFMVNVEPELDSINEEIYSEYSVFFELEDLKDYEISELYATILKGNYYKYDKLTFDEIRAIDMLAFKYDNNTNYILNSNDYDISVSGLVMSSFQEKDNNFINDNVFLNVIDYNDENLKNLVVNNGYDSYNQFSLQLKRNSKIIDLNRDIVVSIKKPEGFSTNQIFIIFEHVDDKFIKLQTSQSDNYISFRTGNLANYIVASVDSINSYSSLDKIEVLTIKSSEKNSFVQLYQKLLILFGVIIVLLLALILHRKKR
jgi:hypothetical protein